jgi:MFS family permease
MTTPGKNEKILFWASFFTLIAAGMGAAIRGDILGQWGSQFGFTQTELGQITGMGLAGFGLTIIFFSFFADTLGYGKLMIVAFTLHVLAVVTTLIAPLAYESSLGKPGAYWCLYLGALFFSLANGTCEAVINPLTASLFPKNKTHWLNILHAGWPGGLVLGAVVSLGLNQAGGISWEIRWGIVLLPVVLYGALMVGRPFPKSEAKLSGVTLANMAGVVGFLGMAVVTALLGYWMSMAIPAFTGLPSSVGWWGAVAIWVVFGIWTRFSPGHLLLTSLFVCHALIGYVELGTDNWIIDITKTVLANKDQALMAFIWTNVLMFTLRFFAGPIVHKISPLGLLFTSAVLGALGLVLLGIPFSDTTVTWMIAVTVYGVGKTFYWPTMLGVISERFPKGGALALGFSGGIGMLSAGLLGAPGIGYEQDYFAVEKLHNAPETYARYEAMKEKKDDNGNVVKDAAGQPVMVADEKGYLEFTGLFPKVAGLDGAKVNTLLGDPGEGNGDGAKLNQDIKILTEKGYTLKDYPTLQKLDEWWRTEGKPNEDKDTKPLQEARFYGSKQALLVTAAIPATLAVLYLLMILYFRAIGGYRQIHIDEVHGGMAELATPR